MLMNDGPMPAAVKCRVSDRLVSLLISVDLDVAECYFFKKGESYGYTNR